jgi:hypothetical protein
LRGFAAAASADRRADDVAVTAVSGADAEALDGVDGAAPLHATVQIVRDTVADNPM